MLKHTIAKASISMLRILIFSNSGRDFFWKKKQQANKQTKYFKEQTSKLKKKTENKRLQLETLNWILHEATENKKY